MRSDSPPSDHRDLPGEVVRLWIKRVRRGSMDPRDRVRLVTGSGIEDDANRGSRKRQVTLIEEERWQEVLDELGAVLDPGLRRANILIRGLAPGGQSLMGQRRRVLRCGPCRLMVWSETAPCRLMDEGYPGLQEALRPRWRGGAFATVLEGGEIAVGDPVRWEDLESPEGSGIAGRLRHSREDLKGLRRSRYEADDRVSPSLVRKLTRRRPQRDEAG